MDKLIRNDRVAVLYSPGYGAGWFTWHRIEELLYDPSIVAWVEAGELDKIDAYVTLKYPTEYFGGLSDLTVSWVTVGERFRIDEYDGNESITLENEQLWLVA